MRNDYKWLEVSDNLPDLGEGVLEEEIEILAPYLAKKLSGALGQTDGDESNNQGGTLRQGQHRKAG
jgi:hypothetical protein